MYIWEKNVVAGQDCVRLREMTNLENLLVADKTTCFHKTGIFFFCLFVSYALFAFVFNSIVCNLLHFPEKL